MKKNGIFAMASVLFAAFFSLCSCGPRGDGGGAGVGIEEKVDAARTQLYVSNFNGGYGDKWLKDVKLRFEEKNKEVSYEAGKTGVQIMIDNAKTSGTGLIDSIAGVNTQVFFSESVNYRQYVAAGRILDITDMMQEKLTAYGEDRSIFDKLNDMQKNYLSVGGKYYAVPHYEGYNGISIDVDLFDKSRLFLGRDGKFQYKLADSSRLSLGPDNTEGTYDDGLPATYEEFYELCATIKQRGMIPFTWSGEHQFYVKNLVSAMAADDNGRAETELGFTFDGTSENLIVLDSLKADGTYRTESGKIGNSNGYDVLRQEGYYNALKFLETIISNEWYSGTSFTDGQTQTDTQDDFLLSGKDSSLKSIAMIVEGCWWESEATDTFNKMAARFPNAGKADRRFRFIPFPKSSEAKLSQGQTLLEDISSYGFINANIDEKYKSLALEFLQFCNTDRSLVDFTVTTNTPKALQYEMSESDLEKCSYFGRSVYERKNSAGTSVVYPLSDNALYNENYSTLAMTYRITYGQYLFPSTAMKEHSLSAEKYFTDLNNTLKGRWSTSYGKYFAKED